MGLFFFLPPPVCLHLPAIPPSTIPPLLPCMSVFTLLLNYYSCTDCKMYYFVQLY